MRNYRLNPVFPCVDDYLRLRQETGLSARSRAGAEAGLPNTLFGVSVLCGEEVVGMGRVIGDGGCFMQVVDVAVQPLHQRRGLGRLILKALMAHLQACAHAGSYLSLIAEPGVSQFYRLFGFEPCAPSGEAMFLRFPLAPAQLEDVHQGEAADVRS